MKGNQKSGFTRRRFIQVTAVAGICAGLGISGKAVLDLLYPKGSIFSGADAIERSIRQENLRRVPSLESIWQAYTKRQFSPTEMNEFLRTRKLISFSAETLQRIKRQQLLIDGAERTLVAAMGDSIMATMYLDFLRPEIKRDPTKMKLGALEARLGGVLHKYSILSQNDHLIGVVPGTTPIDLYTNAAFCTDGCEPNESLLEAVIRNSPQSHLSVPDAPST
jgi:hypothetical protein